MISKDKCYVKHAAMGRWALVVMSLVLVLYNFSGVVFAGDSRLPGEGMKASSLADLFQELRQNNLELRAMEQRVKALQANAPYAGSLSDPVIGVGLANVPVDSFELDQEAMTQKQIFIAQKFPWIGTLDLRQQGVELKAVEAGYQVVAKRLNLESRLAKVWYDLVFLRRSLDINRQLQAIVGQSLHVAESRYGTGVGLQQDILSAQVQLSEFLEEQSSLESRIRALRAQMGSLLNRSGDVTEDFVQKPGVLPPLPDSAELLAQALVSSPALQARMAGSLLADNEIALAEKEYMPGFDVRLSYGQREDNPVTGEDRADFVSATVSMTVPLWQKSRQDSQLAAARQRKEAAESAVKSIQSTLRHDLGRLVSELQGIRNSYEVIRDAQAVQAKYLEAASLAAYSTGNIEFDTMLRSRIRVLKVELTIDRFQNQYFKKLAELGELTGVSLIAGEVVQ